jgi:hypothetical protein
MRRSRLPPSLNAAGDQQNTPRPGYVRSEATHIGTEWSFEVLSDDQKVAIATIQTGDGVVHIGLNREEATTLLQKLQLFLQDWPKDQLKS